MAHNLNFHNNRYSFASTEKAWHGLGQIVEGAMTAEEVIKLAQLDFEVTKEKIYTTFNGNFLNIPGKKATIRTDNKTVLGVVSDRYHVVQNKEVFTFFDAIVDNDEAIYETAGVLGLGERIFVSAKLPYYINIKGHDDPTEVYIILTSSHNGTGSIVAGITPVRVVCNNTLNMALRNIKNKVSIKHTLNAKQKLHTASNLMNITNSYVKQMNDIFNNYSTHYISDDAAKGLINKVFESQKKDSTRIKNIREDVWKCYQTGIGQENFVGTAYGLLNGISFYLSHKDYTSQERRFESLLLTSDNKLQKAHDELLKLVY